ncbi:MAG: ABC transporter substrate-binding protein [Alphaproteobacteria bacterium]|jgi:peptide/nickel transport system substrate-binding protein|nr:ABC transporter substrate-binding protein [Alphaproteobacteria bacterium]MDP6831071.1 ABC transporter substrate-binding protein [Alphaproteobacteria bacterium]
MKQIDKKQAELKELAQKGRISRRDFMAKAAAMGVTVAAATTLWSDNVKAAPKRGGKARIGSAHGNTTDTLDPGTFNNGGIIHQGFGMRNHLTEVNNDGSLIPELCEKWEASDDATEWTFTLRKGVEFHNGKTLDTNDIIASMNHHRGKDSKSAAKPLLAPVKELKADGPNKVVFKLSGGSADFPFVVSDYHLAIMPADKEGKVDWQSGIGTGAYAVQKFEPGVRSTFKRHPNYFKAGRGHFDEVEFLTITDVVARTNALTTGEIDMMSRCDLKTVHLLKRRKGINVEEVTGTLHYTIPMHTDVAPFDNNDVRMALKYALDREVLLKTILRGHGVVGNDHPISTANRFHNGDLPQRKYDLDKAKFHLKKSGLSSISVDLSAADAAFVGAVDAAVLYKEHAAKAGININVVREPSDGYWSNVWLKKPWCMVYWGGRPIEDMMFSQSLAEGADWNESHFSHKRFNELLVAARAELNEAKRRAMYYEMQEIVNMEGGTVVPLFANYVFASSDKITHDKKMAGNWDMDGDKAIERWWFK